MWGLAKRMQWTEFLHKWQCLLTWHSDSGKPCLIFFCWIWPWCCDRGPHFFCQPISPGVTTDFQCILPRPHSHCLSVTWNLWHYSVWLFWSVSLRNDALIQMLLLLPSPESLSRTRPSANAFEVICFTLLVTAATWLGMQIRSLFARLNRSNDICFPWLTMT